MLGGIQGGRTGRAGFPFGAGSSNSVSTTLNISTDDARRRHVAVDDAVEQARILITLPKGGDCPGEAGLCLNLPGELSGGLGNCDGARSVGIVSFGASSLKTTSWLHRRRLKGGRGLHRSPPSWCVNSGREVVRPH